MPSAGNTTDDADVPPPPPSEHDGDSDLPGYTVRSQTELSQQEYVLDDSKGRPWIWLQVKSRARGDKQLPLFFEQDTVSGTVQVDFSKSSGDKAVTISVLAGVTAVGQDECNFLNVTNELWNAKTSSTKAVGKQTWAFAITLPTEATVIEPGKKQQAHKYPLPPSFSERASPAYIDYRLVVTVKRSSFRVNHTLATNFAYLPLTRANLPSALRQLSYREGSSLVGPEGDPDGWKVLPSITVSGTIFDSRKVELKCTLAIATPLTYALGSPIPIMLTLRGADEQALDLLSTPSAVNVHLSRIRMVGSHATQQDIDGGRSNNSFSDNHGRAFFWPSGEGAPEPGTRVLQGELEVKKSLKLGFVFPRFSLRYFLVLSQFRAPGFVPAAGSTGTSPSSPVGAGPGARGGEQPLIAEPVTITSVNASGITPRSYAPPGYADGQEGDYNTVAGYLENGNQRFLHHHGFGS